MQYLYRTLLLLVFSHSYIFAQNYNTVGDAIEIATDHYRLTDSASYEAGAIWHLNKIDLSQDFDLYFEMNFGSNPSGADGIAFVIQPNSTSLVVNGNGIGYKGISPSIVCQFDTYQNSDDDKDPSYDHMALFKNGSTYHDIFNSNYLSGMKQMNGGDVKNGQWYNCHVSWRNLDNTQKIQVVFNCTDSITYEGDMILDVFGDNPMTYFGFTAATGAEINEHQVRFNYISFYESIENIGSCLNADPFTITNTTAGVSYAWSPSDHLDDPNISSPTFTPSVSGTHDYTLEITDVCGNIIPKQIQVNVAAPFSFDIPDMNTCNTTIDISAFTYIPIDNYTYLWSNDNSTADVTYTLSNDITSAYVDITPENGCAGRDYFTITKNPSPLIDETPDEPLCPGKGFVYDMDKDNTYPNNPYDFEWSTGDVTDSIIILDTGYYHVTATNEYECSVTRTLYVFQPEIYQFDIPNTSMCEGYPIIIDAPDTTLPHTYEWSTGSDSSSSIIPKPGLYRLTISPEGMCPGSDQILVDALPKVEFDIPDQYTCAGNEVNVSLDTLFTNASYLWSSGDTTKATTISTGGEYSLTITLADTNFCPGIDEFNLAFYPNPIANFANPIQEGVTPYTVNFANLSSEASSYNWYFLNNSDSSLYVFNDGQLNPSNDENPIITFNEAQLYDVLLVAESENGCIDSIFYQSIVVLDVLEVTIGNAFTPNNDGVNDYLKPEYNGVKDIQGYIYNRWGKKVYEWNSIEDKGWNGKINGGSEAAGGTYFVVMEVTGFNGKTEQISKYIQLIKDKK